MEKGAHFGPYEILAPLGAGGMGEVYRAADPRLQREVALKILLAEAAGDSERQRRFLQEARAASALNHPNILTVYDVGTENGTQYIVSELIEGDSLRKLLLKGPIPFKKFLDIAIQIADGLAAAHEAGIVHRDLKPENVMINRDGRVKILDFGLAKPLVPTGTPDQGTVSALLTGPGVILGTTSYMSPEQARGQETDFRSDQFSLGLILYEMATGKQAFHRDTPVQTLSAIIAEDQPPISTLNPKLPSAIRWQIERCMAKDPRERYGATIDVYHELKTFRDHLSETSFATETVAPVRRSKKTKRALVFSGLLLLALAAGFLIAFFFAPQNSPDISNYRFTPVATTNALEIASSWSPDGKSIAFNEDVDGFIQIFVQNLETSGAVQITHSDQDSFGPFWSPDGTRLFFTMNEKHKQNKSDLWAVSATGGTPELVLENVGNSTLSPDGKTLFFFRNDSEDNFLYSIWSSSPPGSKPQRYAESPFASQSYTDGRINFSQDGSKMGAWMFNPHTNQSEFWILPYPKGKPRKILSILADGPANDFSWMPDGRNIVLSGDPKHSRKLHLWLADTKDEKIYPLTTGFGNEIAPLVSPDGRQIAFSAVDQQYDLVQVPLDKSPIKNLTSTSWNEKGPAWSPNGNQFAYASDRNGSEVIWIKSQLDGSEKPLITEKDFPDQKTEVISRVSFSPDGQRIAYHRGTPLGAEIWISTLAGGSPVRLIAENRPQFCPTWSPDGNWIAYVYNSGGKFGIAKAKIGSNQPAVTLKENVVYFAPQWSPKGDWISYQTNGGLFVVSPDGKNTRSLSKETWLANGWSRDGSLIYGVRQDEKRHLRVSSIRVDTAEETLINDLGASPLLIGGGASLVGFSLAPDGKSFATAIQQTKGDIWLLRGFQKSHGFLARFRQN